jgi:hypothetical protein
VTQKQARLHRLEAGRGFSFERGALADARACERLFERARP